MSIHHMGNLFPATRDVAQVADDSSPGLALLDQAGFIRQTSAGIYSMMPLGYRSLTEIERIIDDEMDRAGVQNVLLPLLQPEMLFKRTGRWGAYTAKKTLFTTTEQHQGGVFALAPTAEEVITAVVQADLQSYRQLPVTLHQIGTKFRDEQRTRGGLLRGREFRMSDAYSFDRDAEGMQVSYERMIVVYRRIFARLGLPETLMLQADSGDIGGDGSAEFVVPSPAGEAEAVRCSQCDYAANIEVADGRYGPPQEAPPAPEVERVRTPGVRTIADLCRVMPTVDPTRVLKTLVFVDRDSDFDGLVAVCIRGDLDVDAVRLSASLGHALEPADPAAVLAATGVPVGAIGPLGLRGVDRIVYDTSVKGMKSIVCGANRPDHHLVGLELGRDLSPTHFHRVHRAADGHGCPNCTGTLKAFKAIEVGHVFQLGTRYTEPLGVEFIDQHGQRTFPWMGCYGIGTTRLVQAVAETRHDEQGLIWPDAVAPFDTVVVVVKPEEAASQSVLAAVVERLSERGRSVLIDDRPIRAGRKFADADLLGIPSRITIGRDAAAGRYEIRCRATGTIEVGSV